jgi:hypothetical protein
MPKGITDKGNPVDDNLYNEYLAHALEQQTNGKAAPTYDDWYTQVKKPAQPKPK